jgi:thioredoxin reductase (NADPH)
MFGKKSRKKKPVALKDADPKIKAVFQPMKNPVPVLLFTVKGKNEQYCNAARNVIEAFGELTPKISLNEFDADHSEGRKRNIQYSPTMIFDPENCNIRWYGAPVGEETRTFIELVLMIGNKRSDAGEESKKILNRITSPRNIRLFISPT